MGRNPETDRLKVRNLYEEYWAILLLTNGCSHKEREAVRMSIARIRGLPKRKLSQLRTELQRKVNDLREFMGVTLPGKSLYALVAQEGIRSHFESRQKWRSILPGLGQQVLFLSKCVLSAALPKYSVHSPEFADLPPHAMISIDTVGEYSPGEFESYLLEATLFEDMAALWNLTWQAYKGFATTMDKSLYKPLPALNRAAAKAAFNLLEGYANGLAVDPSAERPRTLNLKQKLLRYPKMVLRSQHPPIADSNCAPMGRVLELEQRVRHSLIHPTPRVPRGDGDADRETEFRNLSVDRVGGLCDDVVETMFSIDGALEGTFGHVRSWLARRLPSGEFDKSVFT